ncbi:MAG: NAD-dependent succinate-semialdehyde dehydrogenase [Nitrososphaeria archaeon]|nr:NAD-dependent succinate-semialdehyde dehydrogenase [Nitrososphaeria archaeon]NDB51091.1 NAD-dependent succinate-semialdehyde dehydrogenase [Nitrosopumilaceae archaeon]NDB87903.1 NAD-dependent succinate-semialdehyde dehydrogenase [Nitrososphaerota archaeon]NDB46188.1 NAD-dependent succinate-semialdehyde dehydrogenase [Nitrososphaeria archaeon]NDB62651.1 NAD-dependent succinate-semialdehyde dehydrogenase [Nitrosopumilaceae archaeon]
MSTKTITTINPATGEPISTFESMSKDQVRNQVSKSRSAFSSWKNDLETRRAALYHLTDYLRKNKVRLAEMATKEMGKVLKEAISEVEKCAWALEFYADNGGTLLSDEILNTDARKSFVTFEPLGIIGSIMPWNFPYWQALRFAAPSLIAGNTIIMKPSSVTMQCGIEIEKACREAGVPDGVFQTLVGGSESANHLIEADVNAVTFTGSTKVGAMVGQKSASLLKKCVLELGGSDPFIVLEDANVEKAANGAIKGRFINCGQSCVASKRFFVSRKIANEFIERFVHNAERLQVGDPMAIENDIGPLVNKGALENISSMVEDAKKKGAQILTGGQQIGNKGYFYKPTILTGLTPDMRIYNEETFGPVAPVTIFDDEKDAIRMANDSEYGLGASIWTDNLKKAEQLSKQIESGIVTVNNVVISDPRVPFGGIKHSGFGRELSKYGMLEFVNIKSIRFYDQLIHHHYVE